MISIKRKYQPMVLGLFIACNIPSVSAASRAEACKTYASTATAQYQLNKNAQCNYSGPRWSNDYNGQKQWCMGVRPTITQSENTARDKLLTACYESKADVENNKYPIPLPGACRWNRENYKPVRYIYTRNAYNQPPTPTAPVPGGLISWDFNKDRKMDYIFIERSPAHTFRSILCTSSSAGWKRQQLSTITEDIGAHFSAEGQSLYFNNGKFSMSTSHHEHNWGSDSSTWTYAYSMQHKALLLETFVSESTSGDGMRENTKSTTDYVKGEIRETVSCSSILLEMGCKPKDNVVTKMKPADYTVAKRRFKGF